MRADRLLSLLMLLQTRGQMTADELSEELEVSVRTIYRDIDALSLSGVPVYANGGPGGGYALLDSYKTDLTGLSADEIEALFLLSLPGPLAALPVSKVLKSAVLKLSTAMSRDPRALEEHLKQRLFLDSDSWFRRTSETEHLAVLQNAVWQDRKLRLSYRDKKGKDSQREIDPYALVSKTGIWYLVAGTEKGLRVFRVSRIIAAEIREESFSRPEDFDLTSFWKEWSAAFLNSLRGYQTRLAFSPREQGIISEIHPSLQKEFAAAETDGNGWKVLPWMFSNIREATGQVLQMGSGVRVVEPEELQESVAEQAAGICSLYGS